MLMSVQGGPTVNEATEVQCCPTPRPAPPAPDTHPRTNRPDPTTRAHGAGFQPREQATFDPLPCCEAAAVQWYAPLVGKLTRPYLTSETIEADDLCQEATLGIIKAYRSFDITLGNFAAYVQQCVFTAVMDHLRASDPVPVTARRTVRALPEWFTTLTTRRQPFPAEVTAVAAEVGLSEHRIRRSMLLARTPTPVEVPDTLTTSEPVDAELTAQIERAAVLAEMSSWSPRDRTLFLDAVTSDADQATLARVFRITQPRVSQILSKCWSRIDTVWSHLA